MRRLLALTLAVALHARTTLQPAHSLFTHEDDIEIGKQTSRELEKKLQLVSDPQLTRYIANLGKRLVAAAPYHDYPFTFKVVKDKNINAFALPGGPVYVNTGTIEAAENESQLAGALAHEISHVVLRHSSNSLSKEKMAKGGMAILGEIFGSDSILSAGTALGINSALLKNSRDHERQADLMGTQILYDSDQWDANELSRFFEKLERQTGSRTVEFFSDHPNPGNRVQMVAREASSLGPPRRIREDDTEFTAMRRVAARIDGELKGDIKGEAKSAGMKAYSARNYRISYPGDWEVEDRSAPLVLITEPGTSNGATIGFEKQSRATLDEATRSLLDTIRRDNPGMRVTGATQRVTIGGVEGESVTLHTPSAAGGTEIDWVITAFTPGGSLWYVVFMANERDYSRLRPTFQQMIESVRLAN